MAVALQSLSIVPQDNSVVKGASMRLHLSAPQKVVLLQTRVSHSHRLLKQIPYHNDSLKPLLAATGSSNT